MKKLIKDDWESHTTLLYLFNVIIVIYIVGVDLGCWYEELLPSVNFLKSMGTAINFITTMMIILAATTFSGISNRHHLSKMLETNDHHEIFWSRMITLAMQYLDLVITASVVALVSQKLILHGAHEDMRALFLMGIDVSANTIYVFMLASATILFSTIIKHVMSTVAAGVALEYLGEIPMGIFMILIYHHRWLKWNPFNFLLVQSQLIKPIDHTMSKMPMPGSMLGAIFYGCIFLAFAYAAFDKYFRYAHIKNRSQIKSKED